MKPFKFLNIEEWERKNTFLFYKDFDDPCFNITANVEVTTAIREAKSNGRSFFLTCLFYASKVANGIESFRYRLEGHKVKVFDTVHPGSTLLYDNKTFGYAYFQYHDDMDLFIEEGVKVIDAQKKNKPFVTAPSDNGFIYFSVIPWISFTHFKHARDNNGDPSIPRIVFGKYFMNENKYFMPVSVEVHHALMDGFHVGQFFQNYERYMA